MSLMTHVPGLPIDLPTGGETVSLSWQVSVLGDMVATLETLTTAGQHHIIGKVVAVVRDQVRRASPLVSRREREMLAGLVEEMARESVRVSPDLSVFTPRAERLIGLLALVR
jgi:hypothetical protein